jgi:hypothetical protein
MIFNHETETEEKKSQSAEKKLSHPCPWLE